MASRSSQSPIDPVATATAAATAVFTTNTIDPLVEYGRPASPSTIERQLSEETDAISQALQAIVLETNQRALRGSPELFCQVPEHSELSIPSSPLATVSVTPSPSPGHTPGQTRSFGTPTSANTDSCACCSICLSPIKKESRRRSSSISKSPWGSASKSKAVFKAPCCGQLFHKECLARHKAQACSPSQKRACPLCRSIEPSGLTPSNRPQPTTQQQGGFVSGWALHNEMVRRASAARAAVQRSLQSVRRPSSGAASPVPSQPPPTAQQPTSSVFFTSPGEAYQAVRANGPLESRFPAEDTATDGTTTTGEQQHEPPQQDVAMEAEAAAGVSAAGPEVPELW